MEIYAIIGSTQKHAAVSKNGIVPTLTSAMGMGGGQIPMIVFKSEKGADDDKTN